MIVKTEEYTMTRPVRFTAAETRRKVVSGEALLVCAYVEEEKYIQNRLEGAISFDEFNARRRNLPRDQEIIFYCA